MKKFRRRKKKKISTYHILIAIVILWIFQSIAYSIYSSELKIEGLVSLVESSQLSESEATWEITQSPWTSNGMQFYQIRFNLTNNDAVYENWEVKMKFPPYVVENKFDTWSSANVVIEKEEGYDLVTLSSVAWNGYLDEGANLSLGFVAAFSKELTLNLTDLIFNNKSVEDFRQIGNEYIFDDDYWDIPSEDDEDAPISESSVTWAAKNSWMSGQNIRTYQLNVSLLNNDKDVSSWSIAIEFDGNIDENTINQWISPSTTVEREDGITRVILKNYSYNGTIKKGSTFKIQMQIGLNSGEQLNVRGVVFNGKRVVDIVQQ